MRPRRSIDVESGEFLAGVRHRRGAEGVLFTDRTGGSVFVASEAANLVHVIDTVSRR